MRENPGVDRSHFDSVEDRLAYCDLRSLEQIITNALLWTHFEDVFRTKEILSNRFRQLAPLRNANAHLRETDDLVSADAEAAVIWFRSALARVETSGDAEIVDVPMDEEPERELDAVDLDQMQDSNQRRQDESVTIR